MPTIPIEGVNETLAEFVEKLTPGEEVVLTRDDKPIAVIRAIPPKERKPRRILGTQKGSILYIAPDFDDPM